MGLREAGGAGKLLLFLGLLLHLLAEKPASSINVSDSSEDISLNEPAVQLVDSDANMTEPKEVEFGPCTVTCGMPSDEGCQEFESWERMLRYLSQGARMDHALERELAHEVMQQNFKIKQTTVELFRELLTGTTGIGIREVILTNGCPGGESKCIVRVEECRGPTDCGWGKPISESLASVKIPCIFVPPEDRFTYTWKMLIPDQQSLILPNDSAILEVHRDTHPVAFQCDTSENGELIASVKYTVYTTAELETRRSKKPATDIVLVFVLITGVIVCVGVLFAIVFIILNWEAVKTFWQTKIWKSREEVIHSSHASTRTTEDSEKMPTANNSQTSQVESPGQERGTYQEWNAEEGEN